VDGFNKFAFDIDQLLELARSKGKSANYIWNWSVETDGATGDAKFDAAVAEAEAGEKKRWNNALERRRYLSSLAATYAARRGAIWVHDEEGIADLIHYPSIVFAASSLARAGRADDAWRVVENTLARWWPVDVAQVVPVELLIDEGLRPLMTPERCAWVLRTPRGPAALPAATTTAKKKTTKKTKKK
jgi:hypothetical protein